MSANSEAITLKDLAQRLGIHPSTVSRVLHSDRSTARGAASEATAQRIRDLAAELGYSPDPQATSLRTRKTRSIGVVVPRLSDLVLAVMYEGIEQEAAISGYSTFVTNSRDEPGQQRRKIELLLARRVDGLIIGDAHLGSDVLPWLARRGAPFVLMSRRAPGYLSATCDDVHGGALAAEHLWERGHRRVGIIAGERYASTAVDRTAGFVGRWRTLGGDVDDEDIVWSRFDTRGGHDAAEQILRSERGATAMFAVNDFAAIGAMGALRARGMTAGTDCAVVGFNDTSVAAELPIPLTSVRSPMSEIGQAAVVLLQSVFNGSPAESVRLRPTLCVRESSA